MNELLNSSNSEPHHRYDVDISDNTDDDSNRTRTSSLRSRGWAGEVETPSTHRKTEI